MSFLRNRIVIVTISITIAVFILAGISNMIKGSPVANVVGVVFSPAQKLVSHIASAVNDFTAFIWEMREYKEENERLVVKLNELQKENRSVEDYKAENERLKDLLGLKQSMSEYSTIAARIIAYEPNNWYDALVIDKGTADGLSEECVVLTSKGIVGQITSIGTNWARVSVITDMENALGVRVVRSGDVAIVEGDVALSKRGYCKMSFMDKNASVVVGDMVETSGLGGVYPPGILVGRVREIKSDNAGAMQYAVIEPAADLNNLHEVLVILG